MSSYRIRQICVGFTRNTNWRSRGKSLTKLLHGISSEDAQGTNCEDPCVSEAHVCDFLCCHTGLLSTSSLTITGSRHMPMSAIQRTQLPEIAWAEHLFKVGRKRIKQHTGAAPIPSRTNLCHTGASGNSQEAKTPICSNA